MLQTILPAEMKSLETAYMEKAGVSAEELMRRAASHVARTASRLSAGRPGAALCLCGTGNNGGDGLAAMRMLAEADRSFRGECWVMEGALSPDAERELSKLKEREAAEAGEPRVWVRRMTGRKPPPMPERVSCVLDAMLGTGLSRPVEGMTAEWCEAANTLYERGVPVIAVDIPSGLNGETGEVMGRAVRATETVTFHRPKAGLYLREGPDYAGRVTVADIGISDAALPESGAGFSILEQSDLAALLPPRRRVSHKGNYGRALLWAGSRGMAGAAALCATAALRTGAGLVTVACPEKIVDVVQTLCPCATCIPLPMEDPDKAWALLGEALDRSDALGAGCGLGREAATQKLLERLLVRLQTDPLPAVLDADALNLLAGRGAEKIRLPRAVLTPHPGEAGRLLGCEAAGVTLDPVSAARRLMRRYGAGVVLKGAASVLVDAEEGEALNPFGTPAMAKGGSGDALTGVIAALLAMRAAGGLKADMSGLKLLQTACALHGLAGEAAEERFGERGALATDLCAFLGTFGGKETPATFPRTAGGERDEERAEMASPLGRAVTVTVDHRLGTRHPERRELVYELNYGYVQDVLAADNEWQDAYVYGVTEPVECFEGEVVAVVHRLNDPKDQWVVADRGARPGREAVMRAVRFQERFFETRVETLADGET